MLTAATPSPTTLRGVDLRALPYRFDRVAPAHAARPDLAVVDPDGRFRAALPGYVPSSKVWDHYWLRIPVTLLAQVFTPEERFRFWYGSSAASRLSDHIDEHEELLAKINAGLWAYSLIRDYNAFGACFDGLRKLALPGFDLRLVWTRGLAKRGWARQAPDVYLDADLGLLVYHRGRHVMTVGFGLGERVFLAQVQLRAKTGNRWLYALGQHQLDLVLEAFYRAFGDQLALVDGVHAVELVHRSYQDNPCTLTPEDNARIAALYDRPLRRFARASERMMVWGRAYWPLGRVNEGLQP